MLTTPLRPARAQRALARDLPPYRHRLCDSGEPVGSRTLSRRLGMSLSPATIRNVMADLEGAGLLYAPHTSAGRLPTEAGLAPVRPWAAGSRRAERRRAGIHRGPVRRQRPQPGRGPGTGKQCAGRPLALRRAGGGAEVGARAAPYRIRPSGPRPGPGGDRDRRRPGGKPHHRRAHGPALLLAHRGQQFPLEPAGRPHHRRRQGGDRQGAGGPSRRAGSADPAGGGGGARQLVGRQAERPDRARPGQAAGGCDGAERSRAHPQPVLGAGEARKRWPGCWKPPRPPRACRSISAPKASCSAFPAVLWSSRPIATASSGWSARSASSARPGSTMPGSSPWWIIPRN